MANTSPASGSETPLMLQWRQARERHPGCLIMTRLGDFYEFFAEDAELVAPLLGIVLTSRNNGGASQVALAGVPVRTRDEYVRRLVAAGHRVAILEQVENPADAKGVVRREVVETITPGSAITDALLPSRRNNHLIAVTDSPAGGYGLAAADVSTGELLTLAVTEASLGSEIGRLEPAEILIPSALAGTRFLTGVGATVTVRPDWTFDPRVGREELVRRFNVLTLDGFGFEPGDSALIGAAGALVSYVAETQPTASVMLRPPRVERPGETMPLDRTTVRNLELVEPLRADLADGEQTTLLAAIDRTVTPMGARLLRRWLLRPLLDLERIRARHEAVGELLDGSRVRGVLRAELRGVRDLERMATRIAAARVSPRELRGLGDSLARLPALVERLKELRAPLLARLAGLDPLDDVADLLGHALADEPGASLAEGGVIRPGYDAELDELREARDGAVGFIASLQERERERTGIGSLKVGYNQVFGYYLEVTKPNISRVPADYQRKQTLANAERYVTPELKEWEARALGAEERIAETERRLFEELRARLAEQATRLQATGAAAAELDVVAAFAEVAAGHDYVCPEMHDGYRLEVRGGRHAVVERMVSRDQYIPNDVVLDPEARVLILTGPNMGGKSTLLRQVGLIQLLAQVGAFVPATAATLPVCDRIFTRVGASDNLALGQSTYLVEVSETALILNSATDRSLVLLDEIGRGTATYDGVSIAWAVTEYLHDRIRAKVIFATHYHELTQLEELLPAVRNGNVSAIEADDRIVFLYRLKPGGADRSYGIEVARLAGIPEPTVARAREILRELETAHELEPAARRGLPAATSEQLGLFGPEPHPAVDELRQLDLDTMTPIRALNTLARLCALVRDGR